MGGLLHTLIYYFMCQIVPKEGNLAAELQEGNLAQITPLILELLFLYSNFTYAYSYGANGVYSTAASPYASLDTALTVDFRTAYTASSDSLVVPQGAL